MRTCVQVLLEAGEDFVQIVPSNPDGTGDAADDTCVILDRSKIQSVGVKAIGDFLNRLQVYKATVR